MAIETFAWEPDDEASGETTLKTRKSQFGDNYAQVVGDGLNAEEDSWTLSFGGTEDEILPIITFVKRHRGYRSFLWTPPGGEVGLYRCEKFSEQRRPGGIVTLSLTFDRAYHP